MVRYWNTYARYILSIWEKMIKIYEKNGVDSHFTIVVTNEDHSSKAGKQIIQVH